MRCHGRLQALGLLGGGLSTTFLDSWDVVPISLGFLAVLPKPFFLLRGEHLVDASQILCRRDSLVCVIPVLELDTINIRGRGHNKRLQVLLDFDEGLLGVCGIPLGSVLAIKVVVVILFPGLIQV